MNILFKLLFHFYFYSGSVYLLAGVVPSVTMFTMIYSAGKFISVRLTVSYFSKMLMTLIIVRVSYLSCSRTFCCHRPYIYLTSLRRSVQRLYLCTCHYYLVIYASPIIFSISTVPSPLLFDACNKSLDTKFSRCTSFLN